MEEESIVLCLLRSKGAPGPKAPAPRPTQNETRKEKIIKRGGNCFEPYVNTTKRYRAPTTNIPFGVKWQSLKDLVKERLVKESQGGCAVVEFKMEESMKIAAEVLNKHSLSGRPLKVKDDPVGEHYLDYPTIPNEIIHASQAARLGSRALVANLHYKIGLKKLKEVFGMAGRQLPYGLGSIGMMLGPGGMRTNANHLNKGIGTGNLEPAGMGMEGVDLE
ncbi:hypothetical protein A6R68_16004 [Neotoma lepida]|uniref:HnRNP M nuclear localisation signal domain-containing protein n=1 Tax=Neotoma lepida TaxID=56216 RepID=A0A1A6H555_NEOLE|nr:hypothetical protein A6R68_16004 [Neotoma lepida]